MPKIWTYLYSTAKSPVQMEEVGVAEDGPVVLAGYGYGLPISRLCGCPLCKRASHLAA